jgi:hypothetical protein
MSAADEVGDGIDVRLVSARAEAELLGVGSGDPFGQQGCEVGKYGYTSNAASGDGDVDICVVANHIAISELDDLVRRQSGSET